MTPKSISITLPYPPSVNNYYRNVGTYVLISKNGREYVKRVKLIVTEIMYSRKIKTLSGRLKVDVMISPPDNRKRDVDNICKALLDSLWKAGLYDDDSQIIDLRLRMGSKTKNGAVDLSIEEIYAKNDL